MGLQASNGAGADTPPRKARRATRYLAAALAAAGMSTAIATAAQAAPARHTAKAVNNSYRHGLVSMRSFNGHASPSATCSSKCLHYRGGNAGVGVTTGKPKVYLVLYGSQWGTQGTNGQGYATFSGDSIGFAPDLQAFLAGLGTGGEKWSGVMTQYCEGVSAGVTKCPSTAPHIPYPTGGVLAGVWEDSSVASPHAATGQQLGLEAEKAAKHFGNTTTASNRDAQYVVISPKGTDPDHYVENGFCAWHDFTGDSSLGSIPGPLTAFTNLPYLTDQGANCGGGFVNPGNNLDGVTIVEGHEYAETLTDQFPAGGWTANSGAETGDLCAWKTVGPGRAQNLTLSTGSFAVQSTWSNLAAKGAGGCSVSHSTVT